MDKNKAILIAVAAIIIVAVVGTFLYISNSDLTLEGTDSKITVPNTFQFEENTPIATKDNVSVMFIGVLGQTNDTTEFYKAVKANGNASGYENITENTINGYKVYEYAAKPENLKTVKYGSSTEWIEYPPINLTDGNGKKIDADHYRKVYYVSPNNSSVNELTIIAKSPDVDLYSEEINRIVDSISLKE